MDELTSDIAQTAARLVVEDGLAYGPAKRRALRTLGLPARTALPGNDEVEEAVREYLALFCADTQPAELAALRQLALVWMQRLREFRPHLGGAVWQGTATRLSDISLQLFCDDPKSAEIALIDQGVDYHASMATGWQGQAVPVLSWLIDSAQLAQAVGLQLWVYDHDDLRGALRPDAQGRAPRGNEAALRRVLGLGA